LGFDNLKDAWANIMDDYANKNSAYEDRLQTQVTKDSLATGNYDITSWDPAEMTPSDKHAISLLSQHHGGEEITELNFGEKLGVFASDVNINSPQLPDLTDTLEHPREFLASNELSITRNQRDYQRNTIEIIQQSNLFEIDPNPTMVVDGKHVPNPTYGQSVIVGDTNRDGILDQSEMENMDTSLLSPDTIEVSPGDPGFPEGVVLNKWKDPIMFDLITKQALLGTTPKRKLSTFESQYGVIPGSNLTDKASIFSFSSLSVTPQEVNYIPDTHMLGFKANKYDELGNPVSSDILGNANTEGVVWQWDGLSITDRYTGRSSTGGQVTFEGDSYSFDNGLPAGNATEWTIPTGFTYQNSQYGVNAIPHTFGGPVDFMKGGSSYYANSSIIPGFTKGFGISKLGDNPDTGTEEVPVVETDYQLGLPSGYAFGTGQVGNSRFLKTDGTAISTGTHSRPFGDGTTVSFSNTLDGWFTDTSIPSTGGTWTTPATSFWDNTTVGVNPIANPVSSTLSLPLIVGKQPGPIGTVFTNAFTVNFMGNSEIPQVGTAAVAAVEASEGVEAVEAVAASEDYVAAYLNQAHATGFTLNIGPMSPSQFKNIPSVRTTRTWTKTTDYYDSIYTVNSIADTFGGPVDFMTGENSYYLGVNAETTTTGEGENAVTTTAYPGVPGFTNQFGTTTSLTPGYLEGDGSKGISNFLSRDVGGNIIGVISTGTHTQYGKSLTFTTQTNTTIDAAGGINFMDMGNTNATGFTPWDIDATPAFPTQFKGITGTEGGFLTYTKPTQTPTTHTVITNHPAHTDTMIFTNQIDTTVGGTGGINFMSDTNAKGFTPTNEIESIYFTTQFQGVDEIYTKPSQDPTTHDVWIGPLASDTVTFSTQTIDGFANFKAGVDEPGSENAPLNKIGTANDSEFLSPPVLSDDGVLTGDPIHPPGSTFSTTSPGDITTRYSIWTRSESGGENIDISTAPMSTTADPEPTGTITFGGFHIGRIGKLQSGTLIEDYQLGRGDLIFETLYNDDQTATENKFGGNLLSNNNISNAFGGGGRGGEPYVISEIVNPATIASPSIFYPAGRILDDEKRIGSFLKSTLGLEFIVNQELLGTFQQYKALYDPTGTLLSVAAPSEGFLTPFIPFTREGVIGSLGDAIIQYFTGTSINPTYTEYLDMRANENEKKTYAELDKAHRPLAYDITDTTDKLISAAMDFVGGLFSGIGGADKPGPADKTIKSEKGGITPESSIDSVNNMNNDMDSRTFPLGNVGKGDPYTLMGVADWKSFIPSDTYSGQQGSGMPFYFRDLRDGRIIFFRAYLEGISDTISPNWSPQNYIGRSEPVYTYTNSEREISFNLKLFAQTKDELNRIYEKINRLTSMCYPEYKEPEKLKFKDPDGKEIKVFSMGKERMKPPLTKLRLGDLFGSSKKEMTGFIKSLSYTVPEESPWEIEKGKRVPKYITADIGFQVIHSTVPSLDFAREKDVRGNPTGVTEGDTFYGISSNIFE